MSEGQWKRWDAVARLTVGKLTVGEAARVLGLSVRQVRRIRRRVAEGGRAGLQHGNRGRVPVNKLRAGVRARILRLRGGKYRDFNDVHFTEKLAAETPPLIVGIRTMRRLLRAAGVGAVRGRRAGSHCACRSACPCATCRRCPCRRHRWCGSPTYGYKPVLLG